MDSAQSSKTANAARLARKAMGYAISGALMVLILNAVDVPKALTHIAGIPGWAIIATALIGYLSIPLRVVQWRWLLAWHPSVSNAQAFRALCVGYLGNAVLPMRGGEFVKAYLLSKTCGIRFARVLATVVVERVQDVIPILLIAASAAFLIPVMGDVLIDGGNLKDETIAISENELRVFLLSLGWTSLSAAGMLVLGFWKASWFASKIRWILHSITIAKPVSRAWAKVETAFREITSRRALLGSQAIALLCWILFVAAPIPLLMSFSLPFSQACLTAIAVTGIATFAHLLPSAPGAIGTFDALSLFAVLLCNPEMDPSEAAAFTFVAHAIGIIAPALPGLVLLPGAWEHIRAVRTGKESFAHAE